MKNTEFKQRAVRHGELLLLPVDELPAGAVETFAGKSYVCAHSETGHHHVAVADSLNVFSFEGRTFMRAGENGRIEHKKSFDFHETKALVKGLYEVTIKKAYDYFTKRRVNVQD
jgi:hypothetical protein